MSREFVILSAKEFDDFAKKSPLANFQQTSAWGELKKINGWQPYFIGVKSAQKLQAAALLLKKPLPFGLSLFYSPRGFLLDYNDTSLLQFFTNHLKSFAKSHKAIFVKIDPAIIHLERDINGDPIPNGINNTKIVKNLQTLGFSHHGFNLEGNLAPQYVFSLNLTDVSGTQKSETEIFNNFSYHHKRLLRRNEKSAVKIRTLSYDELSIFSDIMTSTAERRQFTDRPLSYYQAMFKHLGDDIIFRLAYIDLNVYEKNIQSELEPLVTEYTNLEASLKTSQTPAKIQTQLKQLSENIAGLRSRLQKAQSYHSVADQSGVLNLGAMLFIKSPREIIYLFGGAYGEFREFNAAYSLSWDMLKTALKNKIPKYNFYGISNFKDPSDPLYGIYEFKKGFGGQVEEYIGEFDFVLSHFWYFFYRIAFELPKKLRLARNNKKFKKSLKIKK